MAETRPNPADNSTQSVGQIIKKGGEILGDGATKLLEGATGVAFSDHKELALSAGYILQAFRGRRFLDTLFGEFKSYCDKGRIKPNMTAL